MAEVQSFGDVTVVARLFLAIGVGTIIGYERRRQHKAIGIAGMVLVALGSTTFMLLGRHMAQDDPAALSRTVQGLMQGIGFLGGAAIFRGRTNVHGIKTAAAVWITGACGLCIGSGYWWVGLLVAVLTALVLLAADLIPGPPPRDEKGPPLS